MSSADLLFATAVPEHREKHDNSFRREENSFRREELRHGKMVRDFTIFDRRPSTDSSTSSRSKTKIHNNKTKNYTNKSAGPACVLSFDQ
jgi:hypothetical protein